MTRRCYRHTFARPNVILRAGQTKRLMSTVLAALHWQVSTQTAAHPILQSVECDAPQRNLRSRPHSIHLASCLSVRSIPKGSCLHGHPQRTSAAVAEAKEAQSATTGWRERTNPPPSLSPTQRVQSHELDNSTKTSARPLQYSHHRPSIVVCVPCVELHDDARHVEGARTCFQPSLDPLMSFCGIFSLSCAAMASAPMHAQSTCTGQFTECACVQNIIFASNRNAHIDHAVPVMSEWFAARQPCWRVAVMPIRSRWHSFFLCSACVG